MQKEQEETVDNIDRKINNFIADEPTFSHITNSQWGMVRNYAKHSANAKTLYSLLFEEGIGCLTRGQSEKEWRKDRRKGILKDFLDEFSDKHVISVAIKLSSQMAKQKL